MSDRFFAAGFWNPRQLDLKGTVLPGFVLVLLLLPLSFLGDLRENWLPYLLLSTAATVFLYVLVLLIGKNGRHISMTGILGIALLLRLAMLPMQPSLSDDAYRYLWDGRLVLHGYNPYHYVPEDSVLSAFHDELLEAQGYPTTNTIYPPGMQLVFAGAAAIGEISGHTFSVGYLIYKLLLIVAEMVAIVLLLHLLQGMGKPLHYGMLYAWHPLAVVELAGQGHTDAFWVVSLALGIWYFWKKTADSGLVGLALGASMRLFPLLLFPLWMRFLARKEVIVGLLLSVPFILLLAVFLDPVALDTYSTVLTRFTNYYEFNGGFYYGVKAILDTVHIKPSNVISGSIGTVTLLVGALSVWLWPVRERTTSSLAWRMLIILTLQIILPAKVHIWYFVAPLFVLPLFVKKSLSVAWLWVALIAPWTYLMYAWEPHAERMEVLILEWGGFLALLWGGEVARLIVKQRNHTE